MPGKSKRSSLFLFAFLALLPGCGPDATDEASAADGSTASASIDKTGIDGGMFYSCEASGPGSVVFTPDGANGYSVTWSSNAYVFCGKGWSSGAARAVTYAGAYTNAGAGAFGMYGWTTSPLVEYYVVEKAGDAGGLSGGVRMGSYVSDGATYVVYRNQRVNQPSIIGVATFYQYVAVRQTPRTSGVITLRNHFDAWARLGMRLGTFGYQLFVTEAWNGAGSARVKLGACCTAGGITLQ